MESRLPPHFRSLHSEFLHPHSDLYPVVEASSSSQPPMDANGHPASLSVPYLQYPTSEVDYRTSFYSYVPNEVKHRRRTSKGQLSVLEEVFKRETKPNGNLRRDLASKLHMSARGVQVWFQNRRAKEKKQLARRRSIAAASRETSVALPPSRQLTASPRDGSPAHDSNSSTTTEVPPAAAEQLQYPSPEQYTQDPSVELVPVTETQARPLFTFPNWHTPSAPPADRSSGHVLDIGPHETQPPPFRRGSLPAMSHTQLLSSSSSPIDPLTDRRGSVDGLNRLGQHPYATYAMERNGNNGNFTVRHSVSPPGAITIAHSNRHQQLAEPVRSMRSRHLHSFELEHGRPGIVHRASMPHVFSDVPTVLSPGSAHVTMPGGRRSSENHAYTVSSRGMPPPIPGPLPTPNFSFGTPATASSPCAQSPGGNSAGEGESEVHILHPDLASLSTWAFPRGTEEHETEDDTASVSFDAFSRFGSIAGSESSSTSAFYSDVSGNVPPDAAYEPAIRRGSCASGFLEVGLSGLDMNSRSSQGSLNEAHLRAAMSPLGYSPKDNLKSPTSNTHAQKSPLANTHMNQMAYGFENLEPTRQDTSGHRPSLPNLPSISRSSSIQHAILPVYPSTANHSPNTNYSRATTLAPSAGSCAVSPSAQQQQASYCDRIPDFTNIGDYGSAQAQAYSCPVNSLCNQQNDAEVVQLSDKAEYAQMSGEYPYGHADLAPIETGASDPYLPFS